GVRVELERPPQDLHFGVRVLGTELLQGFFQVPLAYPAERADDVGPDVNAHDRCNGARLRGIPVGRMSLPYASYRAGLPASVPTSDCASARAVRSADLR